MTPTRKPYALPVEGASIAEALSQMDNIHTLVEFAYQAGYHEMGIDPVAIVRSALERAAAEGEAWRVVEEWRNPGERPGQTKTAAIVVGLLAEAKATPVSFVGVDRTTFSEALQAAADWIKAEGAK